MPDPILTSIATALATKAASGLFDLVKRKFASSKPADDALKAAQDEPGNGLVIEDLVQRLADAERDDPEFSAALRSEWQNYVVSQQASQGGVNNQISGSVSGKALQAGDIDGDVSF